MLRAYSLLQVKEFEVDRRTFGGFATTPTPDRVGDVIEPEGVKFAPDLPLLLYHDNRKPVGAATFGKATKSGIPYKAIISEVDRPGVVKDRINEAIDSLNAKPPLIKGVSIGFRPLKDPIYIKETGGFRYPEIEVVELSLVVVPANAEATVAYIKSLDAPHLAASGTGQASSTPAGVSASPRKGSRVMQKTYGERITDLSNKRAANVARMDEIQQKSTEEGRTKDAQEREEFDGLMADIQQYDAELKDLRDLEEISRSKAVPVAGNTPEEATKARGGDPMFRSITVSGPKLDPGIGFARAVKARVVARMDGRSVINVAKEMYPSDDRLHAHLTHQENVPKIIAQIKAAVPAATTTNTTWASALVDPTNLPGEFIEYLRPATIIGKLNLRDVPFNVRMIEQTQGGTAYWVGQGAPKPVTAFGYAPVTLSPTKIAAIVVATQESIRFSSPKLDTLVRDGLRDAVVERADRDLLDPAEAGSANVQPASLTNGLTALTSAGTSADNARTDLGKLVRTLRTANLRGPIAIVMPDSLLTALAWMVNALGQPEFPGLSGEGGTFNGLRFIGSEYLANASGAGNMVVAIAEREVYIADDGSVAIDASDQASLQMLDNPTNNSATATATTQVSMWQTNSVAFRAERFINWQKRRSDAVAYIDDVNWGSIGSPTE